MQEQINVQTLGTFCVKYSGTTISDETGRSYKLWKIFKYLITNRHKIVTTELLIEMIWPDEQPSNPLNSLQALIFRLRKLLNKYVGGEFILFAHNSYQWNPDVPVDIDVVNFERHIQCARDESADERKIPHLKKAIELYKGDYLPTALSEIWSLPVTNYYRRMYIAL